MAIHEEKVELLRKVDIFSRLREYELDIIARYSEFMDFERGRSVFKQGEPATEMYVVNTGRVGIISIEEDGDVFVAQIMPGESFGELDFFGRTPRSATSFTDERSVLLRFPSRAYPVDAIIREQTYLAARLMYGLLGTISERIWNVTSMLYDKTRWLHDLRKQLLCDKTTGLYNQTFLKEDFVKLLPDLGGSAALLMIKPDNFKAVNDRYGHEAGDHVLNLMAIFLQSELLERDIGVRYRGDEFAAILADTDRENAVRRAREISSAFRTMDMSGIIGPDELKIRVSMGIALYPQGSTDSAALVEIAHRKMLRARNSGGNRIAV